jgi:hypothetical protein
MSESETASKALGEDEDFDLERGVRVLVYACKDDPNFRAQLREMIRAYELGVELEKEGLRLDEEATKLEVETAAVIAEIDKDWPNLK